MKKFKKIFLLTALAIFSAGLSTGVFAQDKIKSIDFTNPTNIDFKTKENLKATDAYDAPLRKTNSFTKKGGDASVNQYGDLERKAKEIGGDEKNPILKGGKGISPRQDGFSKKINAGEAVRDPSLKSVSGDSDVFSGGLLKKTSDEGPDPCESGEPKGMTRDYQKCSLDCKTVCSYKTSVDGVACFSCQQGGDETCKDIGLLDFPHQWCKPGGFCYDNPELYCTAPTPATTPKRSKVICTSCKKRPDMCWQKVKDGTNSLTNCRLGCWNGTCAYRGKYKEKEWDGSDEFLHCYECITPPPPPTCEDLKWGTDWESDCLNMCAAPGYCEEFEFEIGKKNPKACQPVDTSIKKGEKEDDKKGTRTRGGGGNKGGGGKKPGGGGGGDINDPNKPFGGETPEDVKKKSPCDEVSAGLRNPGINETPPPSEIKRRQKWMKRFQKAVKKLKARAENVNTALSPHRKSIKNLESRLPQVQADLKAAKAAARGADKLGGYGTARLRELKTAQRNYNNVANALTASRKSLKRRQASMNKGVNRLKFQAQRALFQADPSAQLAESISRTDSYYEAYRDHERNGQMKEISNNVFNEKAAELKSKISEGGKNASKYRTELKNLKRGQKEVNAVYDRRQRFLAKDINRMQKENGAIGAGPFNLKTLRDHVGQAAIEINKQVNKLKKFKRLMDKAAKNNCPPKGADKVSKEIGKKLKDLEIMIKNMENRYHEVDKGFPMSEQDKAEIKSSASQVANGSKKMGGVKSRWDFFPETLAEEAERTLTDPGVAFKKAFWYTVGVVEGVGGAIKGLVEMGIGVLDLTAETIEGWFNSGDERLFGRDASETLQKFFSATDGNFNLDGIEKLAQGIQNMLLKYEKKLLGTDMDKTVSRAGGKVAGELVVGDALLAKTLQGASKLRSAGKGVSAFGKGGRVKVLKGGGKTPKTPKVDGLVAKADELAGAGKGAKTGGKVAGKGDGAAKAGSKADDAGKVGKADGAAKADDAGKAGKADGAAKVDDAGKAGKADDAAKAGSKTDDAGKAGKADDAAKSDDAGKAGKTDDAAKIDDPAAKPKEPRAPPPAAKALDNTKPLDRRGPAKKKLDSETASKLETESGFKKEHAENLHKFAQEHDAFVIMRNGNPDSVRHMDNPDFMPKPVTSKAKTAKVGPVENRGLVVDPTHPTQATYWDNAIADAANAGDTKKLKWLKENRRKAIDSWNDYGAKMKKEGYFVQSDGVIGFKDPKTGKTFKGIHGDYDLHGVYKAGPDGKAAGRVSYGAGETMADGAKLRGQLNKGIDGKKDYVQHGGQDDWIPDPKYVPIKPPDPPATVFFPDGRPPIELKNYDDMKKFYEGEMGIKFDYPDPPKKGLSSGTGSINAPPTPAAATLPDFNGVKIPAKSVQGSPKVSTHATSNADLNFVDKAGNQVQLKTGEHLGSGSTSSVYVDKANPQQVIRVTNTMGDVKEAARLDEFGRGVIEKVAKETDSIRIVRQVDRKIVQNQPGSHLNNHVVEIVEKAENGTAKAAIAKQGGKLTEKQAQALNKAVKDLNDRGYAWLDAKPDNYGFEKIPGTDDIRVVVVDPGGIVPMKSPGAARKMQHRIQAPDKAFVEGYNSVGNPQFKDLVAGEEWQNIINIHGKDIDLKTLGVKSAEDVKFNPSGNIGQQRVGQLFNDSL